MAQLFSGNWSLSGQLSRYELALISFFACIGVFNFLDLLTTIYALRIGLEEANALLIGFADYLGLSLLEFLAVIKIVFVLGSAVLVILGVESKNSETRKMVLYGILAFALVFAFACANNLFWILS